MESDNKLLLLEQLKLSYPKADIHHNVEKRDEIIINDIPFKGIKIEITGRIDIYFKGFDKLEYSAISTYFKPRLKYPECRIFYNPPQLNIYLDKKFTNNVKGNFEKTMWTFNVLEYFNKQIISLTEKILDDDRK
jgi:hypothetical protein